MRPPDIEEGLEQAQDTRNNIDGQLNIYIHSYKFKIYKGKNLNIVLAIQV